MATVAAVQAAKNTSQLIPYCHPVRLDFVGVDFKVGATTIEATAAVKAVDRTGVEMEAFTGASVAALTLYDMLKMADDSLEIVGVRLLEKTGGKTDFRNRIEPAPRAAVLVMSDSISAGTKQDQSGPLIVDRLKAEGFQVTDYRVIPDDQREIESWLRPYADQDGPDLVMMSGGTGLSPRDQTPEAMRQVSEREIPGISEIARGYGQERMPYIRCSRAERRGYEGKL